MPIWERTADLRILLKFLGSHADTVLNSGKVPGMPAAQRAASQDRVQISEQAKELQRLRTAAEQPSGERAAKVEHIRQSVEGGTYRVDGKQVADAIMRNVLMDSVL